MPGYARARRGYRAGWPLVPQERLPPGTELNPMFVEKWLRRVGRALRAQRKSTHGFSFMRVSLGAAI